MRLSWVWALLNRGLFWLWISTGLLSITAEPMKQYFVIGTSCPSLLKYYLKLPLEQPAALWIEHGTSLLWLLVSGVIPKQTRTLQGFLPVRLEMPTCAIKEIFWNVSMWHLSWAFSPPVALLRSVWDFPAGLCLCLMECGGCLGSCQGGCGYWLCSLCQRTSSQLRWSPGWLESSMQPGSWVQGIARGLEKV